MIRLVWYWPLRHDEDLVEVAEELLGQVHDGVVQRVRSATSGRVAGSICGSISGCWFT